MNAKKTPFLKHFAKAKDGNALALTALALPALVGAGGLAMDTIHWTLMQRQMQREADSAALAGAYAKVQGSDATAAANASLDRDSLLTLTEAPVIDPNAPYNGTNGAVKVTLTTKSTLPFSSLFLSQGATVLAEATATTLSNGEYCVISLEDTNYNGAIYLQGSARVIMGCGFSTNSKGAQALTASGSSWVSATHVAAVGGVKGSSKNIDSDTVILPHSVAQADPLKDLPNPTSSEVSALCNGAPTLTVGSNTTVDVTNPTGARCYKGMDIQGTVTFAPGVYYIDGASGGNKSNTLSIGAQAKVTGSGVTFILTSSNADAKPSTVATLDMNGGATINLTAPAQETCSGIACNYTDVLFFQDRRAVLPNGNSSNLVNGNANSIIQGAIYFPSQTVTFSGNSGMDTKCIQIVSRRVTFIGNNTITNDCPYTPREGFLGTRVFLVA